MKITLVIPAVQSAPTDRPARCPHCAFPTWPATVASRKPLTDTKLATVQAMRYRCSGCGKTFRHYPMGVSRSRQSQRVMVLAVLMKGLGLSCSATPHLLRAQETGIVPVTVWQDVQALGQRLRQQRPMRRRVPLR